CSAAARQRSPGGTRTPRRRNDSRIPRRRGSSWRGMRLSRARRRLRSRSRRRFRLPRSSCSPAGWRRWSRCARRSASGSPATPRCGCSTRPPMWRSTAPRGPRSSRTGSPGARSASWSRRSACARRAARCSIISTWCRATRRGGDWGCPDMTRVLIAGVSTRGLAESAARAGYDVVAVDGFGDLDLRTHCHEVVVARTAQGRFSCDLAVRQARPLACDAVAYVASFENHPHALRALTRGRVLWGNGPGVVTRARDPLRALEQLNPRTFPRTLPAPPPGEQQRSVRWLVKPRASGGGTGIRVYQPGAPVPHGSYVQEQLAGVAVSVRCAGRP